MITLWISLNILIAVLFLLMIVLPMPDTPEITEQRKALKERQKQTEERRKRLGL